MTRSNRKDTTHSFLLAVVVVSIVSVMMICIHSKACVNSLRPSLFQRPEVSGFIRSITTLVLYIEHLFLLLVTPSSGESYKRVSLQPIIIRIPIVFISHSYKIFWFRFWYFPCYFIWVLMSPGTAISIMIHSSSDRNYLCPPRLYKLVSLIIEVMHYFHILILNYRFCFASV